MKKIYSFLTLLISVFAFTGCVSDVDDAFDKSAAQRAEEAIANTKSVLESAPNGWRMEYYGNTTYGGYNVMVKFEGDSVTVASEKVGSTHKAGFDSNGNLITCKTHFKVEQSMGVVVSFDEYNSVFHYFSDPNNSDYGEAGSGFTGDFEFRVMSISNDKMVLSGKKHGAKILMYRMAEDESWSDYLKKVAETETYMTSRTYGLQVGDSEEALYTQSVYRRLNFYTTDEEGTSQIVSAPYIVTPEGYELYDTVTVAGVKLTGFVKGDTQDYFQAKGLDNVKLYTEVPSLFDTFKRGLWYLTYDDMGTFGQNKWEGFFDGLGKADNGKKRARLYYAAVGYVSDKFPAAFLCSTATESQVIIAMTFNAVSDGNGGYYGNQINFKVTPGTSNKPGQTYYKKYGGKDAVAPFDGHTFTITADDVRHPSYLILTDVNDPTNVIKVWSTGKSYPFGDRDKEEK